MVLYSQTPLEDVFSTNKPDCWIRWCETVHESIRAAGICFVQRPIGIAIDWRIEMTTELWSEDIVYQIPVHAEIVLL